MAQDPKVSIIIPVYNCENFLRRCLDSLVNQTLKDIEIICINDGSTDDSLDILREYEGKDSRFVVIDKENGGQSVARNVGIDRAKGEYLGFVDSDDWVDLDFYEKLYNTAEKYKSDIAVAGIVRLNDIKKRFYLKITDEVLSINYNTKLKLCDVPDKSYIWNKIYKTENYKKLNLKFTENRFYEDVVFTPEILFYLEKLVTVPDTYYYYWDRPNSTVALKDEKHLNDKLWADEQSYAFFKEHNINIDEHKTMTKRMKFLGVTVFKIIRKGNLKKYKLFNCISWSKKLTA